MLYSIHILDTIDIISGEKNCFIAELIMEDRGSHKHDLPVPAWKQKLIDEKRAKQLRMDQISKERNYAKNIRRSRGHRHVTSDIHSAENGLGAEFDFPLGRVNDVGLALESDEASEDITIISLYEISYKYLYTPCPTRCPFLFKINSFFFPCKFYSTICYNYTWLKYLYNLDIHACTHEHLLLGYCFIPTCAQFLGSCKAQAFCYFKDLFCA